MFGIDDALIASIIAAMGTEAAAAAGAGATGAGIATGTAAGTAAGLGAAGGGAAELASLGAGGSMLGGAPPQSVTVLPGDWGGLLGMRDAMAGGMRSAAPYMRGAGLLGQGMQPQQPQRRGSMSRPQAGPPIQTPMPMSGSQLLRMRRQGVDPWLEMMMRGRG